MNKRKYERYLKQEIEKSLRYRRILEKQKDPNWEETIEWRKVVARDTKERVDRLIEIGFIR